MEGFNNVWRPNNYFPDYTIPVVPVDHETNFIMRQIASNSNRPQAEYGMPMIYIAPGVLDVDQVVRNYLTDSSGRTCRPPKEVIEAYRNATKPSDILDPKFIDIDSPIPRKTAIFSLAAHLHQVAHAENSRTTHGEVRGRGKPQAVDIPALLEGRHFDAFRWRSSGLNSVYCPITEKIVDFSNHVDLIILPGWSLDRMFKTFARHLAKKIWLNSYHRLTAAAAPARGHICLSESTFETFAHAFMLGFDIPMSHPYFKTINMGIRASFGRVCEERRTRLRTAARKAEEKASIITQLNLEKSHNVEIINVTSDRTGGC